MGQSVAYAVNLASTNGFNQLAPLTVTGLPSGVTASFKPSSITAGQTAILTLAAPANQPISTATLNISASASVAGIPVSQTANATLSITAPPPASWDAPWLLTPWKPRSPASPSPCSA